MAGFSLGLNRALFPWKRAGVRALLWDAETVEELRALCRPVSPAVLRPRNSGGNAATEAMETAGTSVTLRTPRAVLNRIPSAAAPVDGQNLRCLLPPTDTPLKMAPLRKKTASSNLDEVYSGNSIAARQGTISSEKFRADSHPSGNPRPAGSYSAGVPGVSGTLAETSAGPGCLSSSVPSNESESSSGSSSFVEPLPVEAWPEAWQKLLARTPREPRILWAYPELADDLAKRGDKARSSAVRKLVAELGFPAGSHAFWPFVPLDGSAAPSFFVSGVAAIRPSLVALFCSECPDIPGVPPLRRLLPIIHRGVRYVLLYEMKRVTEDALSDADGRHVSLIRFLQRSWRL